MTRFVMYQEIIRYRLWKLFRPYRAYVIYLRLIPKVRQEARKHGYAIGVHGSLRRDCDLIAVPWTETAIDTETLLKAILQEVNGKLWDNDKFPTQKPFGRLAYSIHIGNPKDNFYIDLSVVPEIKQKGRE